MTEENEEVIISKSQVKREMQALRDLGEELVQLPLVSLKKFSFPERLLDSILLAQSLKREALRRQIQHIGKLLREEDDEAICQLLSQISQPQREEIREEPFMKLNNGGISCWMVMMKPLIRL
jgi:ribosome-associated protein